LSVSSHLGIDLSAKPGQAAERRLDVAAGAAEPVIEIKMPKGGIEIVPPHQAHHATAEPNAFRVSGRAIDGLRRFNEFVRSCAGCPWRRPALAAAGLPDWSWDLMSPLCAERASVPISNASPGTARWRKNRIFKLTHASTHNFPDFSCRGRLGRAG